MKNGRAPLFVGADVGGTFTDLVGIEGTEAVWIAKVPSTPSNPADAVVRGLEELCAASSRSLEDVALFLHGTTIATNAVLQRRGAKTALVTTRGFRDVLAIARQARPRLFDFDARRPEPLIPRHLRFEVSERMSGSGEVAHALDFEELEKVIEELRNQEVESVAVCFLHAYANSKHELAAGDQIRKGLPGVPVSLSSEIVQEYREYERSSTTTINAFVAPVMSRYLADMESDLRNRRMSGAVRVMQSSGGLMNVERACRLPAATLLSGVAAGALGGVRLAHAVGRSHVMTLDMGGTSCDMAVGFDGEVVTNRSYEVGGLPVRLPALDVRTIGAGGGSIAYLDAGGGVHVGPRSAGASPGPACYGQGGEEPTVTDANLVLGRIPPSLLGGAVPLDVDLATEAVARFIADPLGLSVDDAADGIVRVINAAMAREMRVLTVQRGIDPRDFSLVAFGGSGPVHGIELARELQITEVIVPPTPGVTSAAGLLVADTRYDRVRTVLIELSEADNGARSIASARLVQAHEEMERDVREEVGSQADDLRLVKEVEMRYLRQGHELRVVVPENDLSLAELERQFYAVHQERYGYALTDEPMLIVNALLTMTLPAQTRTVRAPSSATPRPTTTRSVAFDGVRHDVPIVDRARVNTEGLESPVIIEQLDTTVVVPPECAVVHDAADNLIISLNGV